MILKHKAELAGRVKLQISGGARGTIDYPWQDNMILDQGLRYLLTNLGNNYTKGVFYSVAVGSSSNPVQPTDVGLITPIAYVAAAQPFIHGWNAAEQFGWTRCSHAFPRGAAAGNISEVTTSYGGGYTSAFARALVRDSGGNPTTITVLNDEVLTVTWETRKWWTNPESHRIYYKIDSEDVFTDVSYIAESAMFTSIDGKGSGVVGGWGGSLISDFTAIRTQLFSESQGNPSIVSVKALTDSGITNVFPYQTNFATFTPPIPKTTEFQCRLTWELTLSRRTS